jgi:hypothetical protein
MIGEIAGKTNLLSYFREKLIDTSYLASAHADSTHAIPIIL